VELTSTTAAPPEARRSSLTTLSLGSLLDFAILFIASSSFIVVKGFDSLVVPGTSSRS